MKHTLSIITLLLAGCAAGPVFHKPETAAPQDWQQWRTGDLPRQRVNESAPSASWWTALGDPVLDQLQRRAVAASPDLHSAALHVAQARTQLAAVKTQSGPQLKASAGALRQRQSEHGAATRMLDVIGGGNTANRDHLVSALSSPFTDYQAGIDASWELDLWGRVARTIEGAEADVATQAAMLELARQSLAGQLAQHYLELRSAQAQQRVIEQDIAAQQDRLGLLKARVAGGLIDHFELERQAADLAASRAQLPALLAQQARAEGQLEALLGEPPGALRDTLAPASRLVDATALPELALGLPSELAQRRPDIRAAEARLRKAVATIGVAQADLYPSIRIGAHAGLESYQAGKFSDWGSRSWSIGPSLDLPIFDRGRRQRVVQLRELEQQEAAVNYQQTVVKAWHEIDDALNGYAAEREQTREQQAREGHAQQALDLASAKYAAGAVDFTAVLDAQRALLQTQRERVASAGRLQLDYVALARATAALAPVED